MAMELLNITKSNGSIRNNDVPVELRDCSSWCFTYIISSQARRLTGALFEWIETKQYFPIVPHLQNRLKLFHRIKSDK